LRLEGLRLLGDLGEGESEAAEQQTNEQHPQQWQRLFLREAPNAMSRF
jgi:hypothetical protein